MPNQHATLSFPAWAAEPLLGPVCRGLPGGNSLFFASPKKSKQKKGDPQSGSLRCATGTLRCSNQAGSRANSPLAQTSTRPDPLGSALLSPARTGLAGAQPGSRTRTRNCTRIKWPQNPFCLRRGAQGQTDQGPRLSEPKASSSGTPAGLSTAGCPQRSEGSQVAGSPFFCLLFFGEAKKSE